MIDINRRSQTLTKRFLESPPPEYYDKMNENDNSHCHHDYRGRCCWNAGRQSSHLLAVTRTTIVVKRVVLIHCCVVIWVISMWYLFIFIYYMPFSLCYLYSCLFLFIIYIFSYVLFYLFINFALPFKFLLFDFPNMFILFVIFPIFTDITTPFTWT